jgi:glycosyltransferase involved in cell wall biosynthesis
MAVDPASGAAAPDLSGHFHGRPALSLVIPAWNSGAFLASSVETALAFFARSGIDGEVVVADDGSTDGSAASLPADPRVRVLSLPHGGKGAALRAGMLAASGEIRAFTDADLPYGLEPLLLAMQYIRERRFHVVVGDRTLPGSTYRAPSRLRRAISGAASFAFRTLVTGGIYDTQCGFKVLRGDIAGEIFRLVRIDGFAIDVELIYLVLKHRLDMKRIPVQLQGNAPSSVRVIRDSIRAARDIATIRFNLALGRYRSPYLGRLLELELQADVDEARSDLAVGTKSNP